MDTLPTFSVVVPVLNEEAQLEGSVISIREATKTVRNWARLSELIIVDNGSTDGTAALGLSLAKRFQDVRYVRIDERGRGRALRRAWVTSQADILSYMDVDLSTDLGFLAPLLSGIVHDRSDVCIGSRLARGAHVKRGLWREVLSRGYNSLARAAMRTNIADLQCGFKAIRATVARRLLPEVVSEGWFFDSELVLLAEKAGFQVREVPVRWIDDADSRVRVVSTIVEYCREIIRMRGSIAKTVSRIQSVKEEDPCAHPCFT